MRNKRIFCITLAAVLSASILTGCKPTILEDEKITSSTPETTAVITEKADKSKQIEEDSVKVEETGTFAVPIGTNGDNNNMNSNLDVALTVLYGSGGQFYDSEAIYGYLKNKDTLIFDSPMFEIAYDYVLSKEKNESSVLSTINTLTYSGLTETDEGKENLTNALDNFKNIDVDKLLDRLISNDISKYKENYIYFDKTDFKSKIKNESEVFSALYKSIANYYNAKFFGMEFTSGTSTFEGDPELVYNYTTQNGGEVVSMIDTNNERGFEMSVDSYFSSVIVVNTKYNISGSKASLYQEYNKTDTFFLIPEFENDILTFKIDFVFSPTDYIYSYTDNPAYDENMKLIPKEVITSDDGCIYLANN